MPFVLDASVTACWVFQDEQHPDADLAVERLRTEQAFVPSLWWFEVRNILVVNERRGRISQEQTAEFLRHLSKLPIVVDRDPGDAPTLRLARIHALSVYDAAYLELATRMRIPLVTLDAHLRRAAERESLGELD